MHNIAMVMNKKHGERKILICKLTLRIINLIKLIYKVKFAFTYILLAYIQARQRLYVRIF